jgi:hypothetical protein
MAEQRRARLWALAAQHAGTRHNLVAAADACAVAVAVAGVDGGWLSVMSDPVRRALIHATSPLAAELDELQFTLGEGPCADAFTSGRPVLVADLGAAGWQERWPGFSALGETAGAAAVFTFPLAMGAIRIGILGLYRETPGLLDPAALADALVCADLALLLLLNSRAGLDGGGDGLPVDGWSDDHARVYQATGMVSAQFRVALEEALALLRAFAFAHDRTLDEVAGAVVDRRLRLDVDEAGEPAG